VRKWRWFAGPDKPGVFEIAWQQTSGINRIALALERHQVGVIDVSQVTALQDDS
jgi:transducin (beta)-like 1